MTRPEKIRILIVDDYDLLRKGLRVFVETTSDLECVGEASDGVAHESAITWPRSP